MRSHFSLPGPSRLILLSALLTSVLAGVGGGNTLGSNEEWRPIDPSDLTLKTPIVEPEADAEAIFWDIRVDDGGEDDLVLSHYIRIKIFTERGREKQSKIDISFFSGTKIKDVAARTIKPDGSIIELTKDDIVEKIVVKVNGGKLRTKSFAFPALEPGSIIEYKWKEVISNSSANHMRLQFQREIPVQSITYHIKPSEDFDIYPFNMPRPVFQKEKNGFQSTTVTKMPAFHEEPFMPPQDNVRSWAMIKYRTLFSFLFGYETVAAQLYVIWQPYLKIDDDVKRKSAEIVAGATTSAEKLEKIFTFCRTNIKNTSDKTSGFTTEELDKLKQNKKPADTLNRGVGRGVDINLLFAALANAAGFDARIALLPDRGKKFFERGVVIPGALSPSNIAVRSGATWKFFDPGFHYVTSDMLRWQEEGVDALIVDRSPEWLLTPISSPEKSRETRVANLRLDENGTLEGDVSIQYTGQLAIERKELNDDDSPSQREENLKEAVKNRLSTAELTHIVVENAADPAKPFIYRYHVRVPDYAQRTGKRLFLQPAFFEKGIAALFTSSARRYPIYIPFPWSEEDKVTISLPKGYAPDNPDAPPPITAGDVCHHAVKMGLNKDQSILFYSRSFFFGNERVLLFPTVGYKQIKQLFDEVNKSDNHTIALKQTADSKQ